MDHAEDHTCICPAGDMCVVMAYLLCLDPNMAVSPDKDLHRHLLTLEKEEEVDADVKRYRMPYLEKLALMLVDNERNGPEVCMRSNTDCLKLAADDEQQFQPLRQSIIYLFSVLVSHDDPITRAILLHSGIILPSIIHFSHYLTNPLYEDDEEFMDSPQLVSW